MSRYMLGGSVLQLTGKRDVFAGPRSDPGLLGFISPSITTMTTTSNRQFHHKDQSGSGRHTRRAGEYSHNTGDA